jgi:hypothetical protein
MNYDIGWKTDGYVYERNRTPDSKENVVLVLKLQTELAAVNQRVNAALEMTDKFRQSPNPEVRDCGFLLDEVLHRTSH